MVIMRILVNGLSASALSGHHVLYGHLRQLAQWTLDDNEYVVVCPAEGPPATELPANIRWIPAPALAKRWFVRRAWETNVIPRLIRREGCHFFFTPCGTILPSCPVPQATLAQNPWCLVREARQGVTQELKAALQRREYARAWKSADAMIGNSRYMQTLYQQNCPAHPRDDVTIAYQGVSEELHTQVPRSLSDRDPFSVVCVSVMARWKGIDKLLTAVSQLTRNGIPARLTLVGPWPDAAYRRDIDRRVEALKLSSSVTITGQVPRGELFEHYARARVFALLSSCESFGIPAIEAQARGTPVVGSTAGAMAEVGSDGGLYCQPANTPQVVQNLQQLLTDDCLWQQFSQQAKANSLRFRWELCSLPLLPIFSDRPVPFSEPAPTATSTPELSH